MVQTRIPMGWKWLSAPLTLHELDSLCKMGCF